MALRAIGAKALTFGLGEIKMETILMALIAMIATALAGYVTQSLFRKQTVLTEKSRLIAEEVKGSVL